MMKPLMFSRRTLGWLIVASCLTCTLSSSVADAQSGETIAAEALTRLDHRTGWIALGDVTLDLDQWASGFDHSVDFLTGPFEIIGRQVDRRRPVFPVVGERVRLTANAPLIILGYKMSGESRRFEAPFSNGEGISPADGTGLILRPGAVVVVADIYYGPPAGSVRTVWARVE